MSSEDHPVFDSLPESDVDVELPVANGKLLSQDVSDNVESRQPVVDRAVIVSPQQSGKLERPVEQQPSQFSAASQKAQQLPKVNAEFMPKSQQETPNPLPLVHQDVLPSRELKNSEGQQQPQVQLPPSRPQDQVIVQDKPIPQPILQGSGQMPVAQEQDFGEQSFVNRPQVITQSEMVEANLPVTREQEARPETPPAPWPVQNNDPVIPQRVLSDFEPNRQNTMGVGEQPVVENQVLNVVPQAQRFSDSVEEAPRFEQLPVSDRLAENASALPVNREGSVVIDRGVEVDLNRETLPVNEEMPVVSRPEFAGASGVVRDQAPVSDRPVENASALSVNREGSVLREGEAEVSPGLNREASVTGASSVSSRPEALGVVREQSPVSDRPVDNVQASPVNREVSVLRESEADISPRLNREALPVNEETPVVSRPKFTGASGVVREQTPVSDRPVEQSRSPMPAVSQRAGEQPVSPLQTTAQKVDGSQVSSQEILTTASESRPSTSPTPVVPLAGLRESVVTERQPTSVVQQAEPNVVRSDSMPVATAPAPAIAAEVDRPRTQAIVSPVETDAQTVDGPDYRVVSSSSASEDQGFTSGDENTSQRPLVSRQPVVRAGGQSFVMPEAEVVQIPEQPVQTPDVQTSDLDVEIGSVERPAMRVDTTGGSSRTAQGGASNVDLEASAEQLDRTHRVSEQIIRSARVLNREGATQVTMRLDPPELGEVSIRLSSGQNGIVSGEIVVESQKVQEIVQRNLGALRDSLSEQGIRIDQVDVSVDDRGGSNLPDREAFREALEDRSNNSRSNADQQNPQGQEETPEEEPQAPPSTDGGVNFVA